MKNAFRTRARVVNIHGQICLWRYNKARISKYGIFKTDLISKVTVWFTSAILTGNITIHALFFTMYDVTCVSAQAMVIDEFFGGGGNNGAPYNRDFVILKNMGSQAQNISGWTLQYASASGNFNSIASLSGWVNPGDFVRVCYYTGANGSPLPFTCDFTSATNLAAVNGKLALATNNTQVNSQPGPLIPGTGNYPDVVDFVGYGNANQFETEAAPAGSAQYGLKRWQETNHNFQDFLPLVPLPADFSLGEVSINAAEEAVIQMELNGRFKKEYVDVLRSKDGIFYHPVKHVIHVLDMDTYTKIQIKDSKPLPGNSYYKMSVLNDQQVIEHEFVLKCRNQQVNKIPSSIITCREHCSIETGTETPGDLSIFDTNGNFINHFSDCSNRIVFESSGMAKGTYFVHYKSPDFEKMWMLLIL